MACCTAESSTPCFAAKTICACTCRLRKLDCSSRSNACWLSVPGSLNSVLNAPIRLLESTNVAISRTIQPPRTQRRRRYEKRARRCSMADLTEPGGPLTRTRRVRTEPGRGLAPSVPWQGRCRYSRLVAYQSLYRKYRPQRFSELVGQEHVSTALQNAVREGRVGHAYLFSGPAGHGQDHHRPDPRQGPQLHQPRRRRRALRRVRELRRGRRGHAPSTSSSSTPRRTRSTRCATSSSVSPTSAPAARRRCTSSTRCTCSAAAPNALLKTLEEPPEHVVFVLATTDPQKVAPTIRSRTQHFEFTLFTVDEIAAHLADVCAKEGIDADPEALALIARPARARCATRCRCSTRPSPTVRSTSRASARCSAGARSTAGSRSSGGGRRRRRRRAGRAGRAARRRATNRAGSPKTSWRRCATRSCSTPARGRVRVDAPEDARRRARRARRPGRARRCWCACSRRSVRRWSTCAAPTPPTRASCWRSRWCAWPAAKRARRCRRWPNASTGSNAGRVARRAGSAGGDHRAVDRAARPEPRRRAAAARSPSCPPRPARRRRRPRADGAHAAPSPRPAPADPRRRTRRARSTSTTSSWRGPRSRPGCPGHRAAVSAAQPLAVDGGVITFGVPRRSTTSRCRGSRRKPTTSARRCHGSWAASCSSSRCRTTASTPTPSGTRRAPPDDEPPPDDEIDLADLIDESNGAPAVDSVTLITQSLGATVVEEVPRD